MRLEEVNAKALERLNFDKYLLVRAVGKRAHELSAGEPTLLDMDTEGMKSSDIALYEIAQGLIEVDYEEVQQ